MDPRDSRDPDALARSFAALQATETTGDDAVQVRAVMYGLARRSLRRADPDRDGPEWAEIRAHAAPALAALGLIDPFTPLPELPDAVPSARNRTGAAVHGTREGVEFHQSHRIPLCRPCRNWKNADERLSAVKEGA